MSGQYFNNEMVSIITPTYNSERYIASAIRSVLNQTYTEWEMIIVDDGSTDRTLDIIQSFAIRDPRIRLIILPSNGGVSNARNTAIKHSRGRYVAFLDSDDIWLPNKLERQIRFMREKNVPFCYCQYRHFIGDLSNQGRLIRVPVAVDYRKLLKGNTIPCLTVVIDRKVIRDISMPRAEHEDYIAWLSILKKGFKAYGLMEDLARYRLSNSSISANKFRSAVWTWRIYRNVEDLSRLRSIYYFCWYLFKAVVKHVFSNPVKRC